MQPPSAIRNAYYQNHYKHWSHNFNAVIADRIQYPEGHCNY